MSEFHAYNECAEMEFSTTAEEAYGLLDSVLSTIGDLVLALQAFEPLTPSPVPEECTPPNRSALIPLSALMEAQELSRKPKRRKKRGRRQKAVEVVYRRPAVFRMAV